MYPKVYPLPPLTATQGMQDAKHHDCIIRHVNFQRLFSYELLHIINADKTLIAN